METVLSGIWMVIAALFALDGNIEAALIGFAIAVVFGCTGAVLTELRRRK